MVWQQTIGHPLCLIAGMPRALVISSTVEIEARGLSEIKRTAGVTSVTEPRENAISSVHSQMQRLANEQKTNAT